MFTGDNGLAVGQHGWMGKEDIYEHGVRIPLVMAGPGIAENKRNDAYVYLYDIFPTLCEKVGFDAPSSVNGKVLQSFLTVITVKASEMSFILFSISLSVA